MAIKRKAAPDGVPLAGRFFAPAADVVAPRLLGHWLLRRTAAGWAGGRIVEVEAYLNDDPASHSFRGPSARNRSMFGPPGRAYVYLIYGLHHCVNVVCHREGVGEAVLIRAIAPERGVEWMQAQRPRVPVAQLTNGPAKLCDALGIDRALDGTDLTASSNELVLVRNPAAAAYRRRHGGVRVTPRIGITQGAAAPLRFFLADAPSVSRRSFGRSVAFSARH